MQMKHSIDQIKTILSNISENWDTFTDDEQEAWENFVAGLQELL